MVGRMWCASLKCRLAAATRARSETPENGGHGLYLGRLLLGADKPKYLAMLAQRHCLQYVVTCYNSYPDSSTIS